jgi:hypothetical protein
MIETFSFLFPVTCAAVVCGGNQVWDSAGKNPVVTMRGYSNL